MVELFFLLSTSCQGQEVTRDYVLSKPLGTQYRHPFIQHPDRKIEGIFVYIALA